MQSRAGVGHDDRVEPSLSMVATFRERGQTSLNKGHMNATVSITQRFLCHYIHACTHYYMYAATQKLISPPWEREVPKRMPRGTYTESH